MKKFERDIIRSLLERTEYKDLAFPDTEMQSVLEFSGAGYFLSFRSSKLPKNRIILNEPNINGKLNGIAVGFIGFIQDSELILECYSFDQELGPEDRHGEFVLSAI